MKIKTLLLSVFFLSASLYSQIDLRWSKSDQENVRYEMLKKVEEKITTLTKSEDLADIEEDYLVFIYYQFFPKEKYSRKPADLKSRIGDISALKERITQKMEEMRSKVIAISLQNKPDFLNSGFLEMATDGSTKGAVRVLRLRIGEPSYFGIKRFSVPLYLFVSANGNDLSKEENPDKNKATLSDALDPLGGTLDFYLGDNLTFIRSKYSISFVNLSYQIGGKLVQGEDLDNGEKSIIFNGYASAGIIAQTGAWDAEDPDNVGDIGRTWIQARLSVATLSQDQAQKFFENVIGTKVFGLYLECGLVINNRINLKISASKPLISISDAKYEYLKKWVVKFSVDFAGT